MDNNIYIEKGGQKLRCGFTTGSCAAAAAKAALVMLLDKKDIFSVSIVTPKGPTFLAELIDIKRSDTSVSCAVIKDGGDDPDVTSGMRIYAEVSCSEDGNGVEIDGGEGIGRVTKPGLDQPVGEAAINSVPRKMIRENIIEVLRDHGMEDKSVRVVISAPEGKEVATKTFNPKLGIVGGISILGTTGIVEPMSDEAIVATIKTEISVRAAEGAEVLLVAPGNYGLKFLQVEYGFDEKKAIMCSNFVYETVRLAKKAGFKKMLFCGHLGKLVKVAGGIKNTHSAYGDHRMEILCELVRWAAASESDVGELCTKLMECVMTDEAVRLITEAGYKDRVFDELAVRIKSYMEEWGDGELTVETVVFSNDYTKLVTTTGAEEFLRGI
ncbi:MAG: cobalamin biosynthesis protein CbiD [Butyrivibrio sp.]|uniref:cobalt-precorrin-5B (C(1))-methyltransferase CbiD n=1 Tax=Butyrivibrio sp. TaxID=28121 RepID=UPI0025C4704D|nr:cobalt-precorrin-5B (C(1))-methyltransferase CbiD [Butyrivibrio sp.]MBQ6587623.1 cobalamin biosynthesis protein CbiD [Butyrivibrio sp.]